MLEIRKLNFAYGDLQVLWDVDLEVKAGEFLALMGPSGSGKTTLMKLLVGLYRPQEGNIFYNGIDETGIHFDDLRFRATFRIGIEGGANSGVPSPSRF